ncbi:ATP-binding cassette domain-containing protein [Streptosporangium sp. NBC_01756]|uniref:ATP-binding cassette domain-containing protein n=1 Tax=Streptosporangium sp. NBC_01756 TaxID=2975950 RepID=UPI002DDA189D|nr:ATP-binding cassette domain-containing protein [Streptosporangium sp. NBC_01756]WSC84155.1 ATP-binding cassette domain-containing protein [Streptosporangium sp. NBC_01756]
MQDPCVPAIEVADLTQRFGAVLAVDRLSLSIPPGMFYGIVGPNGAGKSTALMAMCGFREPTAGTVRVTGHDLRTAREAALAQLGVMMDGLSLPERLTATEVLRYSAGPTRTAAGLRGGRPCTGRRARLQQRRPAPNGPARIASASVRSMGGRKASGYGPHAVRRDSLARRWVGVPAGL